MVQIWRFNFQNKKTIQKDGLFILELLARFELATSSLPILADAFSSLSQCALIRCKSLYFQGFLSLSRRSFVSLVTSFATKM